MEPLHSDKRTLVHIRNSFNLSLLFNLITIVNEYDDSLNTIDVFDEVKDKTD